MISAKGIPALRKSTTAQITNTVPKIVRRSLEPKELSFDF